MKRVKRKRPVTPESIDDHIKEEFKNSAEFRKAHIDETVRLELAYKIMRLRKARHLSQAQLAKRMKTTQQTISRIENPENTELSISTLSKLAVALQARLSIDLLPKSA